MHHYAHVMRCVTGNAHVLYTHVALAQTVQYRSHGTVLDTNLWFSLAALTQSVGVSACMPMVLKLPAASQLLLVQNGRTLVRP